MDRALKLSDLCESRNKGYKSTSRPTQGAKTWFQHPPHTASGETSVHTPQVDAERASSVGICLAN